MKQGRVPAEEQAIPAAGVYEYRFAITVEGMCQMRAFEAHLDRRLAEVKKQILADRQKLIEEREREQGGL